MTHDVASQVANLKQGLRLPVIVAPMFLVSGPDLVVEACRAGLMGALPGPNGRTIEDLRAWFTDITARLDAARGAGERPAPWAFNMITHGSYGRFDAELDLVRDFRPGMVITALGGPHRVTDAVHGYGGLVFADVNSAGFARKAVDKGADGLVLVCSGAGGHTGEYAMLAFIDEVRRFFDGPIVVGGAISHGRSVRAVELLGADFAYMGTRFIATPESLVSDDYRAMVVQSRMEDLIASRAITGALGNWMRASIENAGIPIDAMQAAAKIDFSGDMHSGVKAWKYVWSAGQGVGMADRVMPVRDLAERLVAEYMAAFRAERSTHTAFARRNGWQAAAEAAE
ncbi:nitronate monooxygenase [Tistrella sp. BH-R2-4]|uniref:Nitronate monooxygenase n=1 Tax=Tistrella arctica TaxID=3133430 RepID=A0ABU9YLV8_9PROT